MCSFCWRERIKTCKQRRNAKRRNERADSFIPAAADCCDCLEAARGKLFRACVAAVHGPVEKVDLVGVELQEEDHNFTAKLMNLYCAQRVRQTAVFQVTIEDSAKLIPGSLHTHTEKVMTTFGQT